MMKYYLDYCLNTMKDISGKLWRVCLPNGKRFDVWQDAELNGKTWCWRVEDQYFSREEYAVNYLLRLIAEKLTGKRIIYHSKREVPEICGVEGAACRSSGKCNTALCTDCPVAEKFFADRDGVELVYAG